MDPIFLKFEVSKTPNLYRFGLNLADEIDLRRSDTYIVSSKLSTWYTCKSTKSWYKNNRFTTSAPSLNDKFKLHDGSYSASDIQIYLAYIYTYIHIYIYTYIYKNKRNLHWQLTHKNIYQQKW